MDAGEKVHIFMSLSVSLPTTNSTYRMRTVDIKKRQLLSINITIEIIFSLLTPPTYVFWYVFVQVWILCSLQCEGADSIDLCGNDQRNSPVAWQIKEKKVQLQKLEAYFSKVFMHPI